MLIILTYDSKVKLTGNFKSLSVWPDGRIQNSPIFLKVPEQVAKAVFYVKRVVFKLVQKVAEYLS